jgi:hypothetical protein
MPYVYAILTPRLGSAFSAYEPNPEMETLVHPQFLSGTSPTSSRVKKVRPNQCPNRDEGRPCLWYLGASYAFEPSSYPSQSPFRLLLPLWHPDFRGIQNGPPSFAAARHISDRGERYWSGPLDHLRLVGLYTSVLLLRMEHQTRVRLSGNTHTPDTRLVTGRFSHP